MAGRLAQLRDVELLEQRVEIGFAPAPVRLHHFEHRADVVLDIEAAEDRGLLRQVADAEPGALVHRQRGDVVAVELDAAAVGLDQAGDHVEHGGLAGAVRAEQADRLAAAHIERDALDHRAAAEALLDAVGGEISALRLLLAAVAVAPALDRLRLRRCVGLARALPRRLRRLRPPFLNDGTSRRGPALRRRTAAKQRENIHRSTSRRMVRSSAMARRASLSDSPMVKGGIPARQRAINWTTARESAAAPVSACRCRAARCRAGTGPPRGRDRSCPLPPAIRRW